MSAQCRIDTYLIDKRHRIADIVGMALKNFPGQVGVKVSEDKLQQLDAIAPEYLRGQRNAARRVQWAVDEFLRLRRETGISDTAGSKADTN